MPAEPREEFRSSLASQNGLSSPITDWKAEDDDDDDDVEVQSFTNW